ncbi:DUF2986 domain-containing protein [Shewanella sp. NIFS-20-20]|uniref:DUF2986 domain-containing protein n=1 Tax=Shewanella sp. NIFS-20-20 TaxID=2853806 RepID=UPI001C458C04|nr:DUF2986 domain-containing protein [Shewanella sp. NIFS-20-20]MBV7315300.1 DUF2986 domain-containing protein [Shewanella sp. NIFS-20-20]
MNRKKKINQTLIAKDKRKKAKLNGRPASGYVSKAERERLAQIAANSTDNDANSDLNATSAPITTA